MAANTIRILLADDHAVVRNGFRMLLAAQWDMEVVGEASNGREAVELAEKLTRDYVERSAVFALSVLRHLGQDTNSPHTNNGMTHELCEARQEQS